MSGGGPLLLIVSALSYPLAALAIIPIEWALLRRSVPEIGRLPAATDVAIANLVSFLVVGLLAPIVIAALSLGGLLFNSQVILGLGTWVGDGSAGNRLAVLSTRVFLLGLFAPTVWIEAKCLSWRWRARDMHPAISPLRASLRINMVGYAIFVVVAAVIWRDVLL